MKNLLFIASLSVLSFVGCKDNSTKELEKKVAELEKSSKEKDSKIISLVITARIMAQNLNHFDHNGTWNFFNEPEFWQNTYEVYNPLDNCLTGCNNHYKSELNKCSLISDSTARAECIKTIQLVDCVNGCRK